MITAPLRDLGRVVGGSTPSTSDPSLWDGEVVWITPVDLGQLTTRLITNSQRRITSAAREATRLELIPPGSVVMSSRAPIGHLGIAGVQLCTNQGCKSFVPGPEVDGQFLYFLLRHRMADIRSMGAGATFAEVSKTDIEGFVVTIPPILVQRRIAADLSAELATINQVSERAGAFRKAVSRLAGLVRSSLLDGLPGPRVPISDLITEPGAIIDGPFGSNLKDDHYKSSGVRVIRLGNIGLGSFIDVDRAYVTPAHAARLQRHRADVGDVVIAALGDGARPAGRACLVPPELSESIVKADCFRVRTAGSDLDGAFLMHVMNSPQTLEYIRGSTRGATRPRMNLQMLKGLEIPVPCMQEQRRIVADLDARLVEVSGIDSSIRVEQEAIDALPAALLRRAFANVA